MELDLSIEVDPAHTMLTLQEVKELLDYVQTVDSTYLESDACATHRDNIACLADFDYPTTKDDTLQFLECKNCYQPLSSHAWMHPHECPKTYVYGEPAEPAIFEPSIIQRQDLLFEKDED